LEFSWSKGKGKKNESPPINFTKRHHSFPGKRKNKGERERGDGERTFMCWGRVE